MKALTNILNYILLLLMILIASCTEDAAEVDDLVRGEEYVTVRMQVPGMKNATTRAYEAEDNLTSVWALVFRDGKLVSKTEVTTAASTLIPSTSTTGTFNLSRPKVNDVIHFLGNVPNGVTLPDVGDDESALCNLETGDRENLSYWGKATYTGTDITVNLYRHLAKIEIAPDPNECTFPEDQLFIAGLVNANTKGKLVPYDDKNEAFNFDLSDENYGGNYDYCTVPAEPNPLEETPLLDNNGAGFKNWLYVFEHENPETADGLYVICKIGKYYYKVALKSDGDGVKPYKIIRNHKYTILVKDLDEIVYDIPDDITEEDDIEEYKYQQALKSDPINLEIKVEKEVALQLIQEGIDENGNELEIQQGDIAINSHANSTEEVTIKVVVPAGVKTLTVQADGFTVTSGDAGDGREMTSDGNNQYTIKEAYRNQENIVRFKLKLNDDVDAETATTITVSGEGEDQYTTVTTNASTTITVTPASETEGTIWWQGLMILDAKDDETKISIPKSYFFNGETPLLPVGSQIVFDFENVTGFLSNTDDDYRKIWMQAADPSDWSQVASQDFVYDGNRATLNVTQEVLDDILDTSDGEYANDNALIIQGQGRILKKITLIRAKESITAEADKSQLYYDSDDPQVVTVNVTVPNGVSAITIGDAEKFTIAKTAGNGTLNGTTYTLGNERTATFTFTLNQKNVTEEQVITFSGDNVNAASVPISMAQTPTVTFTNTGSQTLYWNNGSPTNFQVQMTGNNVPNDKTITLTITAADFTVTAQNGTPLTQNDNVWTYTGTLTTLTFTPTSSGDGKPISITGEGENVNVNSANIVVNVDATLLAVTPTATIDMDNSETSTILTLTKPGNITNLKVTASNNNAFSINGYAINGDYYIGGLSSNNATIDYTIALRDGFNTAGEYTITFTDNGGGGQSVTATITVKNTPSLKISPTSAILNLNDDTPKFEVTATVPLGSTLASLVIAAPEYITIKQSGTTLGAGEVTYSTQINGGNSVTFTFELAEGATIPNGVNSFNVNFTGSGTNLKVNSSVNVSVSNETSSTVNLEITSPSQAHATIDLGSYEAWEKNKSITMQLRIPAGVKQVTFGGESINNFTISTYSGNFNNNVYTNSNSSSSQEVTFTITIDANASLGEHIINISGTGDGITVNGTQLVVTITQTVFGVTPTTTEISNTNSYVDLTIVKPKALTQLCFVISDNNMLMATGNEDHGFQCNNSIYYFYNSPTMEEVIRIKLRDDKTITEEKECTISFYEGSSTSGSAKTVTITLKP